MKKILALLICLVILSGTCVGLISCNKDGEENSSVVTVDGIDSNDPDYDLYKDLVKKDFSSGGTPRTFTIASSSGAEGGITLFDTDDIQTTMNKAVFTRNSLVEAELGVDIKWLPLGNGSGVITKISNSIRSGYEYDVVWLDAPSQMKLIQEGCYLTVDRYEQYMDFEKPWWYQDMHEDLTIVDSRYSFVGDWNLLAVETINMFAFNKDMIENVGEKSPYDYVESDEWTMENLYKISKQAKINDETYCVAGVYTMITQLIVGSDLTFVEKNTDDELVMSDFGDRFVSVYQDICNYFMLHNGYGSDNCIRTTGDTENCVANNNYSSPNTKELFGDNKAVFWAVDVQDARIALPASSINYGFVPTPKYDSDQEEYVSWVTWVAPVGSIPSTVANNDGDTLEMVCTVSEWLTAYSYKYTVPAHYEIVLQGRLASDPVAVDMLDIILGRAENSKRTLELDSVFGLGVRETVQSYAADYKLGIKSGIQSNSGAINAKIDTLMSFFKNNG